MRLLVLLIAALLAAGLAPYTRLLALRFGAHDHPTDPRKVHSKSMPRLGGLAILTGMMVAVMAALALHAGGATQIVQSPRAVLGLGVAAVIVAIFGLLDDIHDLSPWWNLAAQLVAGGVAWQSGFKWSALELAGNSLDLGPLALPLTLFWFVAAMNALNLIDGLDGLAAAMALLALIVLIAQAQGSGGPVAGLLGLALGGAISGFLIENLYPARQFMGTCGSQMIGLLLAALTIGTLRGRVGVNPAIPLLAFGVPLLDMTLAVVRRVARGVSPLRGDRLHLHHRLLQRGYSQRGAVLVLALIQASFAALGLLALWLDERLSLLPLLPAALIAGLVAIWLVPQRGEAGA